MINKYSFRCSPNFLNMVFSIKKDTYITTLVGDKVKVIKDNFDSVDIGSCYLYTKKDLLFIRELNHELSKCYRVPLIKKVFCLRDDMFIQTKTGKIFKISYNDTSQILDLDEDVNATLIFNIDNRERPIIQTYDKVYIPKKLIESLYNKTTNEEYMIIYGSYKKIAYIGNNILFLENSGLYNFYGKGKGGALYPFNNACPKIFDFDSFGECIYFITPENELYTSYSYINKVGKIDFPPNKYIREVYAFDSGCYIITEDNELYVYLLYSSYLKNDIPFIEKTKYDKLFKINIELLLLSVKQYY